MICRHKLYHFMVANLVLGKTGICDSKMIQFMPANHSNTNRVITILIHSDKTLFKTFSLRCYVMLLRMWRRRCFHGMIAMILMPQIFDVTANENARYKRNELEFLLSRSENRQNFWGVTYRTFLSNATTFRDDSDNKRSVRMKHIS